MRRKGDIVAANKLPTDEQSLLDLIHLCFEQY